MIVVDLALVLAGLVLLTVGGEALVRGAQPWPAGRVSLHL